MADTNYTRADWLRDLRSGEFHQGTGALKKNGCYCCIGVAAKGLGASESVLNRDGPLGYARVRNKLTISGDLQAHCITMNDDEGKSFSEIADYLEANFKGETVDG